MQGGNGYEIFIDTAKVEEIKKANDMGVICGVTTNPSLIAKAGRAFEDVIAEIASICRRTDQRGSKGHDHRCRRNDRGRQKDCEDPSEYGCEDSDDGGRVKGM